MTDAISKKTIEDFGIQWTHFNLDTGYYGTQELQDILSSVIDYNEIEGKFVADIGSGTGRIVNQLLAAGASKVLAVEPSDAFKVLTQNTRDNKDKIIYLNETGEKISFSSELDYIFSIGVIHHIPNPSPTLNACFRALKNRGRLVIWIYAKEGNDLYLWVALPLRKVTTKLPHALLLLLSSTFMPILWGYIQLCKFFPLPMHQYMSKVLSKLSKRQLILNIYDQLNPAYAKYYTQQETQNLLSTAGFIDIKIIHRYGYSWTAVGTKP